MPFMGDNHLKSTIGKLLGDQRGTFAIVFNNQDFLGNVRHPNLPHFIAGPRDRRSCIAVRSLRCYGNGEDPA